MVYIVDKNFTDTSYNSYFETFSYELSNFQKWAIKAIVDGDHILITAHTGSGKTLPAEFAINYFTSQNPKKKIIYASPIKALSNQKLYDFRKKYPHISFGLLTGDCKDNPDADVLIMTTEILRNTLFNKKIVNNSSEKSIPLSFDINIDTELAAVIFDEVHYINDFERGSVWEQSILLLPPHIQLIMLSATIDKPEKFAMWIENEKNKQNLQISKKMYLAPTYERVVPLTHYMWLNTNSTINKCTKNTPFETLINEYTNKPIIIKEPNEKFIDSNYYNVQNILEYIDKNRFFVKRPHVLNNLIKYLKDNNMLPAITFIFSRKHVELAAKEISHCLFETNSKLPSTVHKECENILRAKLTNYKEYLYLPEYINIIELLKKGIAIHHAGMMPILREMVELLFEKGYIKLLFATETFAVGINMPTKTVIFSGLTKYNGTSMRQLYSHEYTQMAGRAGRRGIDTVGNVIHCNNLFNLPTFTEYKNILTGPPQTLTSKFKITFGLTLNIFSIDGNIGSISDFVGKSFISDEIQKEINWYDDENKKLCDNLKNKTLEFENVRTDKKIIYEYQNLLKNISNASQKQKKKLKNQINNLIDDNKYIIDDYNKLEIIENINKDIENNEKFKCNAKNYINSSIDKIIKLLNETSFLTLEPVKVTSKGIIAGQFQEIHPLVISDILLETDYLNKMSSIEIAGFLSLFTSISVDEQYKSFNPITSSEILNSCSSFTYSLLDKYQNLEVKYETDTGTEYNINYDIQQHIINWCNADDENTCKIIINELKEDKNIFLGEFVKAILKINNIVVEIQNACEILNNINLLEKLNNISSHTLKFVVTNQSLYI
jgi:antiviral helicase SKI2